MDLYANHQCNDVISPLLTLHYSVPVLHAAEAETDSRGQVVMSHSSCFRQSAVIAS